MHAVNLCESDTHSQYYRPQHNNTRCRYFRVPKRVKLKASILRVLKETILWKILKQYLKCRYFWYRIDTKKVRYLQKYPYAYRYRKIYWKNTFTLTPSRFLTVCIVIAHLLKLLHISESHQKSLNHFRNLEIRVHKDPKCICYSVPIICYPSTHKAWLVTLLPPYLMYSSKINHWLIHSCSSQARNGLFSIFESRIFLHQSFFFLTK